MAQDKDEWWVSREGHRFGPVTFEQMVEAARAGRLEPRTDLVFGGGLTDWVPAGDVKGLFERKEPAKSGSPGSKSSGHTAPEDSLADSGSYDFGESPAKIDQPGAGRLGYFLGMLVLPTLVAVGLALALQQFQESIPANLLPFAPLLFVLVPLVALVITVKRFQNLAMSGWWWLGLLVPILNLWLNYRLFAAPPGYAFTRKLDGIGKFLAVIYWLALIASVVVPVLFLPAAIDQMKESGEWDQLIRQLEEARSQIPQLPEAEQP